MHIKSCILMAVPFLSSPTRKKPAYLAGSSYAGSYDNSTEMVHGQVVFYCRTTPVSWARAGPKSAARHSGYLCVRVNFKNPYAECIYITLSWTQSVRVSVSKFLCPGFWILRSTECGKP